MNVNYKTILLCAVIGTSMQNAWGMDEESSESSGRVAGESNQGKRPDEATQKKVDQWLGIMGPQVGEKQGGSDMAILTAVLAKLTQTCETNFQSIHKRLGKSESKLAQLEEQIDEVKTQIGGFKHRVGQGDKMDESSDATVMYQLRSILNKVNK